MKKAQDATAGLKAAAGSALAGPREHQAEVRKYLGMLQRGEAMAPSEVSAAKAAFQQQATYSSARSKAPGDVAGVRAGYFTTELIPKTEKVLDAAGPKLTKFGDGVLKIGSIFEKVGGKVVSFFAVAGGLAVDCVCQGHPEYLHSLLESMTEVLEDNLAEWVASNGGWTALCAQCKYPETDLSLIEYASKAILVLVVLMILYFIVKIFEKLGIFLIR